MEGTEGRIHELKDKIIQITKSELHRENILKKTHQKNPLTEPQIPVGL